MTTQTTELTNIVIPFEADGMDHDKGIALIDMFQPFIAQAAEWRAKVDELQITDVSQTKEMALARESRLALRDIRVGADKLRKQLKKASLVESNAIQGVYNFVESLILPLEEDLEKKEKFAELQESLRREKLKNERLMRLEPFGFQTNSGFDLAGMDDTMFESLFIGIKKSHEDKIESERVAAEEIKRNLEIAEMHEERTRAILPLWRFMTTEEQSTNFGIIPEEEWDNFRYEIDKRESAYVAEQQKMEAENKRLLVEAEAKEKAMAKEREAAAKKAAEESKKIEAERKKQAALLVAEKEKADRLAKELQDKKDAEEREKAAYEMKVAADAKAAEKERQKAAKAPEKVKLAKWVELSLFESYPEKLTPESMAVANEIFEKYNSFKKWAISKINEL